MQSRARTLLRHFALSASAAFFVTLGATSASAQYDDVDGRLQRIEQTLQDLQAEVYRNGGEPVGGSFATQGPAQPMSQGKLYDVETSLRNLTGQVEQLTFEIRQLKDRYERFERDTQYRLATLENGGKPPEGMAAPGTDGMSSSLSADAGPTATDPAMAQRSMSAAPAPNAITPPASAGESTTTAGLPQGNFGTITAPPNAGGAEGLYQTGMDQLSKAQYGPAQTSFKQVVSQYGDSSYAPQAQFFIADINFVQKNYSDAAVSYAELIKKYPSSDRGPDAMLKLGLSLVQLGKAKEGCTTLGAIRAKYPKASDTILNRAQRESQKAGCS